MGFKFAVGGVGEGGGGGDLTILPAFLSKFIMKME